jgi:hypothetical protein
MFLVVGSLLLCAGLFGCDNRPQATVSAPVAVTATPPCNCTSTPPPAPVVRTARTERRHIRHHWAAYGDSDESTSPQSDTQGYSSSEETMSQDDGHHGHHRHTVAEFERMYPNYGENDRNTSSRDETQDYSESSEAMTQDEAAGPMRRPAWVDGYGRAHFLSDDTSQNENPARLNDYERNVRDDPYRGWNSDCDQRDVVN